MFTLVKHWQLNNRRASNVQWEFLIFHRDYMCVISFVAELSSLTRKWLESSHIKAFVKKVTFYRFQIHLVMSTNDSFLVKYSSNVSVFSVTSIFYHRLSEPIRVTHRN